MRTALKCATLLVVLLLPATALAQASLTGTVRDGSGGVLPGVTVEASSPVLIEKTRSAVTDGTGQWRIVDLRPGTYSLSFTLVGFTTVKRDNIELTGSQTLTIPVELRVGDAASLFTYLHVREDALTLYGFTSRDDLTLFEQLIGVSGVGPRAALGLLSALDGPRLATAIASGQTDLLRKVPGIGQKTAERLVLELRDKVAAPDDVPPPSMTRQGERRADEELVAALMGLGYTQAEAVAAAARVPEDADASLEDSVRAALVYFGAPSS